MLPAGGWACASSGLARGLARGWHQEIRARSAQARGRARYSWRVCAGIRIKSCLLRIRSASHFFLRIAQDADWGSGLYPLGDQGEEILLRGRYWSFIEQSTTAAQDCCVWWTATPGWALLREPTSYCFFSRHKLCESCHPKMPKVNFLALEQKRSGSRL